VVGAAGIAVMALGALSAAPALADEGWHGDRDHRGWHESRHRHYEYRGPHRYGPPPRVVYAPPPRVYYVPRPRVYYAPPPVYYDTPGISLVFPLHID
jgi:hypothetical protein